MLRWRVLSMEFSGSCYRFVYSILLHYCGYRSALPQPLAALSTDDIVLEELHEKHCYQLSLQAILHTFSNISQGPKDMIEVLIASFMDDGKENCGVGILLPGRGHSMLPIQITRCFDNDKKEILTRVDFRNTNLRMDISADNGLEDGTLQLVRGGEEADLLARISDLRFSGQESIAAWMGSGTNMLTLQNPGTQKSYTLALMKFGETFETNGAFPSLDIEADQRHTEADQRHTEADQRHTIVVGSLDSLRTTRIALHVDRGSDGSVDDVRMLRGYGTVSVRCRYS